MLGDMPHRLDPFAIYVIQRDCDSGVDCSRTTSSMEDLSACGPTRVPRYTVHPQQHNSSQKAGGVS